MELCIQMSISFLFSFAFLFFSQLFVRPPQTTILTFYISLSWRWFWSLPPVQYWKKVKSLSRVWLFATPWTVAYRILHPWDFLEWVAISFSRRSSWPRDWTWVSRIVGRRQTLYHLNHQGSPVQYYKPLLISLQALCLSDLIPLIYLPLPSYNPKGFDLSHTWMVWWFSLLF